MPSSEDIALEAVSSPSSSRQRDLGGENVGSEHVPSSLHSGDPAPLDAVVVPDLVRGAEETDESDEKDDEYRPGYEEGLLVILRTFAREIGDERGRKGFKMRYKPNHIERQENLAWASTALSAIKNRNEFLPKLPTDVSHPLLRRIVFQVNRRRHVSTCIGRGDSHEGPPSPDLSKSSMPASGLLQQADPQGSRPSMTSRLLKFLRFLSGYTDQQQEWHSLKTIADAVTSVCPLVGSLRVTVCDFGDGTYSKFDTTLDLVTASESSETLHFTIHLRMLMVTRDCGKALRGESPLDVRLSAAKHG